MCPHLFGIHYFALHRLKYRIGHSLCIFMIYSLTHHKICQATEYCVKPTPTDPENTSYLSESCYTVDHYTDPAREYLKLNNTVFTFLGGEHFMMRPFVFQNVNNITLQVKSGDKATLIPTFVCNSTTISIYMYDDRLSFYWFDIVCSIFQMTNVSNATISGFIMLPTIEQGIHVSAIDIRSSSDIHVQAIDVLYDDLSSDAAGVIVDNTSQVLIDTFQGKYCLVGISIRGSRVVSIRNIEMFGSNSGLQAMHAEFIKLTNITAINNTLDGVELISVNNATLQNIYSISNNNGLQLTNCTDTFIEESLFDSNTQNGVVLQSCVNTDIMNINASCNGYSGIIMYSCHSTAIVGTFTMNNVQGIAAEEGEPAKDQGKLFLHNVTALKNNDYGVKIAMCNVTEMVNITTTGNMNIGIYIVRSINTILKSANVKENNKHGIYIWISQNTHLMDITMSFNGPRGFELLVIESSGTTLKNTLVENHTNKLNSVGIIQCHNTRLMNISTSFSGMSQSGLMFMHSNKVVLEESTFTNVLSGSPRSTTDVMKLPAVIALHNTSFVLRNSSFVDSNMSSIMAIGSMIKVEGNVLFSNISAVSGAAFIFSKSSVLVVSEHSKVIFQNNHANHYGAAFFIVTEEFTETSVFVDGFSLYHGMELPKIFMSTVTNCFVRVQGSGQKPQLVFINNTAERGGDVVYGGLAALGYDGDWNCLLSFKYISDMTEQSSEMPSRRITSAPSRVCICRDDRPDCLTVVDTTSRVLYPGQTMTVSAAVVGQDFGTVKGEVNAQFLSSFDLSIPLEQQILQYENGQCMDFYYTVHSSCETCKAELVLTPDDREVSKSMSVVDNTKINTSWSILLSENDYHTLALKYFKFDHVTFPENTCKGDRFIYKPIGQSTIDNFFTFTNWFVDQQGLATRVKLRFPQEIYDYPLYITLSFRPCPLGFHLSQKKCDCLPILQLIPTVECNIQGPNITRGGSVWIGSYNNETFAVSKYCPLHYCITDTIELLLDDQNFTNEDVQCNYKHAGILCGGCQHGLSLALGSDQCLQCSNAYVSLILPFALAGVLLVVFIKVLNFTVCQGAINGLIFYANVINANKYLYYDQTTTNPITLFIAWFNLDVGIETCFYDGLTAYARTWLQFVFPLYIWCLAGGIIFLANQSRRVAKILGNNGVPVLATLFLLSYAKLFTTVIKAVSYTTLTTTQGDKLVWSVDGNIDYLSPKHVPLFVAAVAALLFLWLPYTLLLLFGKYLHKINCCLLTRILMKLKPFLDANYAPFHDRHQYWFGGILIVKATVLLSSAIIPANGAHVVVFSVALAALLLTFWGQMVFAKGAVAIFHTWMFANLGILNITKLFVFDNTNDMSIASFTLIGLTFAQFLGIIVLKVLNYTSMKWKGTKMCWGKREGAEDDWELYLQASLLREEESENEEEEERGSLGSMESLPTY